MGFGMRRFLKDERGTSFEGIALSVSIIAVAFVASADMLDYMTKSKSGSSDMVAALKPAVPATTAGGNFDETPTASLPKLITRSVLDPCTGQVK